MAQVHHLNQLSFNKILEDSQQGKFINYAQFSSNESQIIDTALMLWQCFSQDELSIDDYVNRADFFKAINNNTHLVSPLMKLRELRSLVSPDLLREASKYIIGFDVSKKETIKDLIIQLNQEKEAH